MLSYKTVINKINKEHPERTVIRIVDYDDASYVVIAVRRLDEIDYDSPFYIIDKESGIIFPFSPIADLDKYTQAVEKRTVYMHKET